MTRNATNTASILALAAIAAAAGANPVDGAYVDGPFCDSFGPLDIYEELGTGAFPADELISATFTQTIDFACPFTDDPTMVNMLVEITNLSGLEWEDLFYVADPSTSFSNVDGLAVSATAPGVLGEAVKIDSLGINRVLVFESMTSDGVLEVGETWGFILQDWGNAFGLTPDAMGSLDFAGASFSDSLSTGSIVATRPIPSPSGIALMAAGAMTTGRRRRR